MKKNVLFKAFCPALFAVCLAVMLPAQTIRYVATTGNDANSGTSTATPYKTIQKALDVATAGTTIQVRAGTYKERLIWKTSGAGALANQQVILTNYPNDTVRLDGSAGGTNSAQKAMIDITNKSYLTVSNIFIQNNYTANAVGIQVKGAGSGITIQNCKIYNVGWSTSTTAVPASTDNANPLVVVGSAATAITGLTITGNQIYNCITGYSEGLTVTGNVDGFTVSNNTVRDITNIGIVVAGHYAWANSNASVNKARNGKVQGNTVYNCVSAVKVSAGIYVDGGENITLERNKSYSNGAGFSIGCENAGFPVTGIVMRDNWAYNNKDVGLRLGSNQATSPVNGAVITNNTFYKNYTVGGWGTEIALQYGSGGSIKQNIFMPYVYTCVAIGQWAPFTSSNFNVSYNLYWRTTTPVDNFYANINTTKIPGLVLSNELTGDPLFVNTASPFDLHIKAGSKAINAGASTTAGTGETDIDNAARVLGGKIDLGADELQ